MPTEARVAWPIPLVLVLLTLAGLTGFVYR